MTIGPREPSEAQDSDEEFLARLGIILSQLEPEEAAQQLDILPQLRAMYTPRCGICGGRILELQGASPVDWVHIEAADRARPHRAVQRPGQFPHRA